MIHPDIFISFENIFVKICVSHCLQQSLKQISREQCSGQGVNNYWVKLLLRFLVCKLLAWIMFRRIVKNVLLTSRILRWELLLDLSETRTAHFRCRCFSRAIFFSKLELIYLLWESPWRYYFHAQWQVRTPENICIKSFGTLLFLPSLKFFSSSFNFAKFSFTFLVFHIWLIIIVWKLDSRLLYTLFICGMFA